MNNLSYRKTQVMKFLAMALVVFLGCGGYAMAQEAPDALVKRVSQDVLDSAKNDKTVQSGNKKRVMDLVEKKVFPYVDIQRTTALAAGRYWQQATPEQQQKLADEFRRLLVYTYAGALSKASDQTIQFKPFRADPSETDVIIRSAVTQQGKESIELDYRLEKTSSGWKIYDLNIMGAWLVETYKQTFSSEISKSGIDGLIKALADKNERLARAPSDKKTEK